MWLKNASKLVGKDIGFFGISDELLDLRRGGDGSLLLSSLFVTFYGDES